MCSATCVRNVRLIKYVEYYEYINCNIGIYVYIICERITKAYNEIWSLIYSQFRRYFEPYVW